MSEQVNKTVVKNKNKRSFKKNMKVAQVVPLPGKQTEQKGQSLEHRVLLLEKKLMSMTVTFGPNALTGMVLKSTKNSLSMDPFMTKSLGRMMDNLCAGVNITPGGLSMLQAMLNPGGEPMGSSAPKITDAAFTQSISIDAHGVVILVPPFSALSTLSSTTQNYSLYIFAGPWLITAFVAVVSQNASRPNLAETDLIWTQFNSGFGTYPDWTVVTGAPNFQMTRVDFTFIDPKFNINSGLSENIQNFRLVGNSLEVFCNTPTWLDQGAVVLSQFATEQASFLGEVNTFPATLTMNFGTVRDPVAGAPFLYGPVTGNVSYKALDDVVIYFVPVGSGLKTANILTYAAAFTSSKTVKLYTNGGILVGTLAAGVPHTVNFDYSTSTSDPNKFTLTLLWTGSPSVTLASGLVMPNTISSSVVFDGVFNVVIDLPQPEEINYWVPPSFDTTAQRQADPHSSAALFKTKGGFYMPARFDQPVFNVTETASHRFVRALSVNMRKTTLTGGPGIDDFIDRNFMTIVQSIEGISYANYPFIKLDRYVEVVPMPGGDYTLFCNECPPKDQLAIDIAREVGVQGPHAYTPDVNALGELFTFITTLISVVPKFMAGAESTAYAVAEAISYVNSKLGIHAK